MPIQFPPVLGQVLICDYDTGFRPPEMVKTRLAVVISPRLPYRDNLCAVVPLSTTSPRSDVRYQCKVVLPIDPPKPFSGTVKWAKADMLATVAFARLTMPHSGRDQTSGKRRYLKIVLPMIELAKVREAVLHALGIGGMSLKDYLGPGRLDARVITLDI